VLLPADVGTNVQSSLDSSGLLRTGFAIGLQSGGSQNGGPQTMIGAPFCAALAVTFKTSG
jgi:hypothetical protein